MGVGYRVFALLDGKLEHIIQKTWNAAWIKNSPLPSEYAKKTILVVIAYYTVKNYKPAMIDRYEGMKLQVNADGRLTDETINHLRSLTSDSLSAYFNLLPGRSPSGVTQTSEACSRYNDWKLANYYPKISDALKKQIDLKLFGSPRGSWLQ